MSLKSRISEWRAGVKEQNAVVSVAIGSEAGDAHVRMLRIDAQSLNHVLKRGGKYALSVFAGSYMLVGAGFGILVGLSLSHDGSHSDIFVVGFGTMASGILILCWLAWGFKYQRGPA